MSPDPDIATWGEVTSFEKCCCGGRGVEWRMKSYLIGQELYHPSLVAYSKAMPPPNGQAHFASSGFFSGYE